MKRIRKVIGVLLEAWGGIRIIVDLLGSVDATKEFANSAYVQIVGTPSSTTLTVTVIAVGLVLLLFEPVKNWWSNKSAEFNKPINQISAPLTKKLTAPDNHTSMVNSTLLGKEIHLRVGQPVHIPLPVPKDAKPGDKFEVKFFVHGPDKISLRDSILLVSGSVLEFVVRRERDAPPYPSAENSKSWSQQQAILHAYDAKTMSMFRQAHSNSVEDAHLKLLLKGLQDPALDRLFNDPGTTAGIKVIGQKLRDLAERLPVDENESEKSA